MRRYFAAAVTVLSLVLHGGVRAADLPSWNEGPTRAAILDFVTDVTTPGGAEFVPVSERIAVFDNDGTLWVEQPMYVQGVFAFDRLKALAPQHPEWKNEQPFKAALEGDRAKLADAGERGFVMLVMASHAGMTTDAFAASVTDWLATAQHPRFQRPYLRLVYQPMVELLEYLRANGFKTFIVSGGGVDFMRPWAEGAYGIPPEQVVGTPDAVRFGYDAAGRPVLRLEPAVLFEDVNGGKPEGIHLVIGKRPIAAFGNSTGDRQMLEYAKAGKGLRFAALVLHDDGKREFAYGPAQGLPYSEVGTFTQKLYDEAKARGWYVISMKDDWKKVFAFEQ